MTKNKKKTTAKNLGNENIGNDPSNEEIAQENQTKIDDPFVAWLYKWRNFLTSAIIVLACGYFIYQQYLGITLESKMGASDTFEQVREQIQSAADKLKNKDDAEVANTVKRIEDLLNELAEAKEPYRSLAADYKELLNVRRGNVQDAGSAEGSLLAQEKDKKILTSPKLFDEMAALLLARSQVDDPTTRASGIKALSNLAEKAQYVNVQAALTMARVADSDEERAAAKESLSALLVSKPEFNDEIEEALAMVE